MNDHNLDDLIIGDPRPSEGKSKSLLAIIALIIIILLMGVFLAKMILGSSATTSKKEENKTKFVSPELIPVSTNKKTKPNNELTPIKKEKLLTHKPKSKSKPKPKIAIKKRPVKKVNKPAATSKTEVIKKKKAVIKVESKTPKPTIKKIKTKTKSKSSELFKTGKTTYYIQVGAFNKDPDPKYLKKIKDAGFSYTVNINEKTRRVRIGPYGSSDEAKAALTDISSSLGIKGFMIRRKK